MEKEKFVIPVWSIPAALFVLAVLSFGILAPKLGFYWDDWAKVYVNQWQGSSGFWQYYLEDRPLSAWTHVVLTPLLGSSPLKWQIFGVLIRWISAWSFWWVLALIWPKAKKHAAFAGALFLVYPLFTMQPLAVTFHQQWMQYFFYFLSLAWMILAFRGGKLRWLYLALSLIMVAAHLSITEYFIASELIRPFLLWVVCAQELDRKKKIRSVMLWWLPYAMMAVAFVVYRLFLIQLPADDPNQVVLLDALRNSPKSALIDFVKTVFADSFYVLVTQWQQIMDIGVNEIFPLFPADIKLSWGLGVIVFGLSMVYWLKLKKDGKDFLEAYPKWVSQMVLIGLLAVLLGCLPAWAAGRRIWFDAHSSRYALPALFGASMFWVGALTWAIPKRLPRTMILSIFLGLIVVLQVRNAAAYQQTWEDQTSFYWQLYWRAPHLEKGTAVLAENELFPNQGSFAISSALNILYQGYPEEGENTPYWFYAMNPRFEKSAGHPLDIPLRTQFRTFQFEGQTPDSVIVYYDPGKMNCMWLLDADEIDNPYLPALTKAMLPASNVQRITETSDGRPSEEIFGAEPEHDWCYFYQKAALAKQSQDWEAVVDLADQARSENGYHPHDQVFKTMQEWMVFVEGYLNTGNLEVASELSALIIEREPASTARVCSLWMRNMTASTGGEAEVSGYELIEQLHCEEYLVQ
ncbi:MAG: hypothetical protein JEZ00_10250 [Anaerolineaceae bacterium]|nr:hypothetical protein [Anaerolineaceae bacterium]